jgi:plasmid segregation protein ParM
MYAVNLGVDVGYGFLKVSDGSRDWLVPSVVGAGREMAYRSELTLYTGAEDNLVVEVDGALYFVGSLAVRQSGIAVRSLAEDRPGDPNARILLLTGLGLVAAPQGSTFHVVTGLPPVYYRPYEEALSQLVLGEHEVVFRSGNQRQVKRFAVERVRVIPQPFGTVYDLFLDRNGNVRNADMANARVGVIDVGFRTTDFCVADRLEYVEHLSFSTTTGLAAAYAQVADGLLRQFRVTKENYEMDEVMATGKLRLAGQVHDVSRLRDAAYQQVADKVVAEAFSAWSRYELDVVYVTGGGGQALAPYLLPRFASAELAPSPQLANVHGYWKLANKIFPAWEAVEGRVAAQTL